LNGLDPEIAIHAFDPGVALDDHFAWQLLLDAGLDLLSSLDKFQPSNVRPVLHDAIAICTMLTIPILDFEWAAVDFYLPWTRRVDCQAG